MSRSRCARTRTSSGRATRCGSSRSGPGLRLVDQTKFVTAVSRAGAQHGDPRRRRPDARRAARAQRPRRACAAIFEDDGPGIPDMQLALTDGYTTGTGLGLGLGGAKRLVGEFEVRARDAGRDVRARRHMALTAPRPPARRRSQRRRSRPPRGRAAGRRPRLRRDAAAARPRSSSPSWPPTCVRHAGGGEIILRIGRGEHPTVDAIACDRGPGIRDAARAREDGYSTGGGPGNGLGAIERLAATMDLQSRAGQGTVVAARLGAEARRPGGRRAGAADGRRDRERRRLGPVRPTARSLTILLADGLGHGADAALAANTAVRELRAGLDPAFLLERIHGALRADARRRRRGRARGPGERARSTTPGSATSRRRSSTARETQSLVSMPGILGHRLQRIRAFEYELPPGRPAGHALRRLPQRLGADAATPALQRRDPLVIASLLIRDFERGRDDVSVVVARRAGVMRHRRRARARRPRPRRGRRHRAPAHARRRRAARLRPARADARRDRGLRARAQRAPLRGRRRGADPLRARPAARSRSIDDGPGHPEPRRGPAAATTSSTHRHGPRPGRRAAADGRVRDRRARRPRHARDGRQAAAARARRRRTRARCATSWRGAARARPFDEVTRQNEELLQALGEVRAPPAGDGRAQPRARGDQPGRRRALRRARRARRAAASTPTSASRASWPT